MSEIADVLGAIEALHAKGERMALATIVAIRGSTYRRPGARLLVPHQGPMIGNISGGCLEGDVADVAKIVMVEGEPRVVSFDLTAEDEAVWGWGLGCNGAIEVFVEPAAKAAEVAGALRASLVEERPICLVTVVESSVPGVEPGARLLVRPDAGAEGTLGDPTLDGLAAEAGAELLATERSEIRHLPAVEGEAKVFVEVLEPPLKLFVCGAGHDAIPLVAAATSLGWSAVVIDDRKEFLNEERFPGAAGFVFVERPQDAGGAASIDERALVVVMTHNYLRDKDYLRSLLASPAGYIGMLGPRQRTERLLADLAEEGIEVTDADRARIHGPAGLDLGAEGPEEIAQAIVAEIVAVRHGRGGGFLREREGPIHDRPEPSARTW